MFGTVMKRTTGIAVGAAIFLAACGRYDGAAVKATAPPSLHPASSLVVTTYLPARDLLATHLTAVAALVTPFHVDATDKGRTITLIGAYADPARTVVIFRGTQGIRLDSTDISDDAGQIDSASSGGIDPGPGDSYLALSSGPHPGSDGIAHLRITIKYFEVWPPPPTREFQSGNWSYSIALKIQPATELAAPSQFALGRWAGTIELLEVTPSVVHLQAVIHGAGVSDLEGPAVPEIVTLLDASGQSLQSVAAGASITVPKQQVNPITYRNSRIRYEWPRPTDAGVLQLRFRGGGGVYTIPVSIPALDNAS